MSTAWPASLAGKIKRIRLELDENKASTQSLFTRKRQTTTLSGGTADRWQGVIETPPLRDTDLRTMWAFLHKVGLYGQFTVGDPDYSGPISGIASASVQGAGQSGTSLVVDGVTPSTTIVREGEYFQVGMGFHALTQDCASNGSGVVTLVFKPALRVSPADNATVTFDTPVMTLDLLTMPGKDTDDEGFGAFALAFEESIP